MENGSSCTVHKPRFLIDRANVAKMTEAGDPPVVIAEALGVSVMTVYRHLKALKMQWAEEAYTSIASERQRKKNELEEVADMLLERFNATGEPVWMRQYLQAQQQIAKILGVNTQRVEVDAGEGVQGLLIVVPGTSANEDHTSPLESPIAALPAPAGNEYQISEEPTETTSNEDWETWESI